MNKSFSIVLQKPKDLSELVKLSSQFFDITGVREGQDLVTLCDFNKNYIIKISSRSIKFIINENEEIDLINDIYTIRAFIENNFSNETIGLMCYDNELCDFVKTDKVNIINLN